MWQVPGRTSPCPNMGPPATVSAHVPWENGIVGVPVNLRFFLRAFPRHMGKDGAARSATPCWGKGWSSLIFQEGVFEVFVVCYVFYSAYIFILIR